ncbi:MAG: hypothetical protein HDR72_02085 [Ruminococcaceae bacterium]|nr:hypothetical protein [Oscillospiraceae bacterium]
MKHKKIISTLLFAVSGALLIGFAVKTAADYAIYTRTVNSAPFTLCASVNALCFITPAAVIASVALYIRRWTRALVAVTLAFAMLTVLTVIVSMLLHHALTDSLLYGVPFALPVLTSGILTAALKRHKLKS